MDAASGIATGRTPLRPVALRLLGDRQLTRLAASGDVGAFAAIYERHHQALYRYCRSLTGDPDDAGDALQSTMAAALRSLRRQRGDLALRPWLFRIAHNESISLIRKRRTSAPLSDDLVSSAPGPERQADAREQLARLIVDVRALPERQRGALLMRELSGLPYDEIAAALRLSEGAARQAVYEARAALSELDSGRDMRCDSARRSLSARDGRVLRGRKLSAHMRQCLSCTDFKDELRLRPSALQALVPPLAAAPAAALLAGVTGAGSAGAAAAGGGGVASLVGGLFSHGAGASSAFKGAAAVAAATVAGVGTVEVASERGPAEGAKQDRQEVASAPRVSSDGSSARAPRRSGRPAANRPRGLQERSSARAGDRIRERRRRARREEPLARGEGAPPRAREHPAGVRQQPVTPPPPPPPPPTRAPSQPVSQPVSQPPPPTQTSTVRPASYETALQQALHTQQLAGSIYSNAMELTQQLLQGAAPVRPR